MFQAFNLLPSLTAEQNVALPLRLAGRRPDRDEVARGPRRASGSATGAGTGPRELSGGQQQRVAIARALVTRPAGAVRRRADRRAGLQHRPRGAAAAAVLGRRAGQTVVMVTHDPVAASYADRVVFLADGRVAGELLSPTPQAVAARMTDLETAPC